MTVTAIHLSTLKHDQLDLQNLTYLATPYSRHRQGLERAFQDACFIAGQLIKLRFPVYSPIAHTHPIAMACGMDPLDRMIWLTADAEMMDAATCLLVAMMEGWNTSEGVRHEIETFIQEGKQIIYLDVTEIW